MATFNVHRKGHLKEGAFRRILVRLESLPPLAREEYLSAIATEDPGWAALLKTKALNLERVFSWDRLSLLKILGGLRPATLAAVIASLDDRATQVLEALPLAMRESAYSQLQRNPPTEADREASVIQLFVHIRELEREGTLDLGTIDPVCAAPEARAA